MTYFSSQNMELDAIATCLKKVRIKVIKQTHEIFGDELIIYFKVKYQGKKVETYMRWTKNPVGITDYEAEDQVEFLRVCPDVKSFFSILYTPTESPALPKVFKTVMGCFGGYIRWEHDYFDISNIDKARMFFDPIDEEIE